MSDWKTILQTLVGRLKNAPAQQTKIEVEDIEARDHGQVNLAGRDLYLINLVKEYAGGQAAQAQQALQEQISAYLDWVVESYGSITLRGIEQQGRQVVLLPLDTVYVPLQAEYHPDETAQPDRASGEPPEARQVALNQVLALGPRLVITGGPGCGKTTVLQHIAWALAEALRCAQPALAQQKLGLAEPLPLPLYVPLSLYNAWRRQQTGAPATLAQYITQYLLRNQTNLELPADFFAHLLRGQRRVLLLLDGLDEVPNEAERSAVSQDIDNLVAGKPNLRVVVTSRSAAYRGQAVLGRAFRQLQVLPLQLEQIAHLVGQAYACIHPNSPLAQTKAAELLQSIQDLEAERRRRLGEDTPPLVDSPLLVRLLLIVHFNNTRLPDQRAELYQKAVDALLRPDYNLDRAVADHLERQIGGSLARNRELLQFLAFAMHQRGQTQGREIEEDALRQILTGQPAFAVYIEDLLAQTRQRGTLLEERGGMYRFLHLTFQEFLCGRYLAEEVQDTGRIAEMLEAGPLLESWWREPILLLLGYLDSARPSHAGRLLLRLAGLDEAAPPRQPLAPDLALAGAELAASAYQECRSQDAALNPRLQTRLWQLLQTSAGSPPRRAQAADALDRLGWQPADLHSFVQLPQPVNGAEVWLGRYPVTNAQYERFLLAPDFADPQHWRGWTHFDENSLPLRESWGDKGLNWLQAALKDRDLSAEGKVYPRAWRSPQLGAQRRSAPVVRLSWYEANAYCRWLWAHWAELAEAQDNPGLQPLQLRLPTEAEWLLAAGGTQPQERYAWDAPGQVTTELTEILRRANVTESGIDRTTPVWLYPLGRSPLGLADLSGNSWEWLANRYDSDQDWLALRGGAYYTEAETARPSSRNYNHPDFEWDYRGFRVALLPVRGSE